MARIERTANNLKGVCFHHVKQKLIAKAVFFNLSENDRTEFMVKQTLVVMDISFILQRALVLSIINYCVAVVG